MQNLHSGKGMKKILYTCNPRPKLPMNVVKENGIMRKRIIHLTLFFCLIQANRLHAQGTINALETAQTNLILRALTVPTDVYQFQRAELLDGETNVWINLGGLMIAGGTVLAMEVPSDSNRFFRVLEFDGDQDKDFDGLTLREEVQNKTDDCLADTDGDLMDDPSELAEGLDPCDPNSCLPTWLFSRKTAVLNTEFGLDAVTNCPPTVLFTPKVAVLNTEFGLDAVTNCPPTVLFTPEVAVLNTEFGVNDATNCPAATISTPKVAALNAQFDDRDGDGLDTASEPAEGLDPDSPDCNRNVITLKPVAVLNDVPDVP